MSGFKIYNSINVNTSFLPRNYPDSLNFIVKGVTHKLSGNGWETSLDTVVIAQNTDKNGKPFLSYKQIRSEVKKIINKAQVKIATENPNLPPDIISPPKSTTSGGTVITSSTPVTSGEKADNVRRIASYLKSIGFTKAGTIGLLGNILGESGANPRAAERNIAVGGIGGIGIVQWTASRRRKLEAEANNDNNKILDLNFQLTYLGKELQKSYRSTFRKLTSTDSISDATIFVLEKFEVPGTYLNRNSNPAAYEATKAKRIGFANSIKYIVDEVYG
jgi:hypothetical protein